MVSLQTFLKLAAVLTIAGSARAELPNEVPILVFWSTAEEKAPLNDVAFHDRDRGVIPFAPQSDHFRGVRRAQGSWVFHEVSLSYGGQEMPLALRTRSGVKDITVNVALPTITSCKPTHLRWLRQVAESAPPDTRIEAMLTARHLLELRSNVCPPWAKRDLGEIYFVMNCSLAKSTGFFRVSEEAKERYRQFARDPRVANSRISACDTQMFGVMAASLRRAALKSLEQGDFQQFAAMNTDLRASADDPDWRGGLAVQGLNDRILKVDWLKGLYTAQQRAASRGDFDRALEVNATLRNLLDVQQFSAAFEKVSLTEHRLDTDRDYLEARAARQPPQP